MRAAPRQSLVKCVPVYYSSPFTLLKYVTPPFLNCAFVFSRLGTQAAVFYAILQPSISEDVPKTLAPVGTEMSPRESHQFIPLSYLCANLQDCRHAALYWYLQNFEEEVV